MKITEIEAFAVVGREGRTTNADEMSGNGVIGKMWSEATLELPVVALYCEYESDKDGAYSYVLGHQVKSGDGKPVTGGNYIVLDAEGEVTPQVVVGLWQQIWAMENAGVIKRAYQSDFELYSATGVELYVGLKR